MLSSWLCFLDSEINLCFGKWIAWELMGSGQMTSLNCANMSKVSNDIRSRTSLLTTCARPALMIRGRRWSTFFNSYPPTSSTSPMAYHLVLISEIYVSTLVTFFVQASQVSWCRSSVNRRTVPSHLVRPLRVLLCRWITPPQFLYHSPLDKCRWKGVSQQQWWRVLWLQAKLGPIRATLLACPPILLAWVSIACATSLPFIYVR